MREGQRHLASNAGICHRSRMGALQTGGSYYPRRMVGFTPLRARSLAVRIGVQPICPVLAGSDGAYMGQLPAAATYNTCSSGCGVVWQITL